MGCSLKSTWDIQDYLRDDITKFRLMLMGVGPCHDIESKKRLDYTNRVADR